MSTMNRIANASNRFQGDYKRVLCVCSAGLLRSPSAAFILSQPPFNFNTRAAGISADFALVVVDEVLLYWAQEIVCMTKPHEVELKDLLKKRKLKTKVICLEIPDAFAYRDPELLRLIAEDYTKKTSKETT